MPRIRTILGKVLSMSSRRIIIMLILTLCLRIHNHHPSSVMLIICWRLRRKYLHLMLIILIIRLGLSPGKWIKSQGKLWLRKPSILARKISTPVLASTITDHKLQIISSIVMLLSIGSITCMRSSIYRRNVLELGSIIWANRIMSTGQGISSRSCKRARAQRE